MQQLILSPVFITDIKPEFYYANIPLPAKQDKKRTQQESSCIL